MAADNMGIFRVISLVSLLRISTSRGNTCENAGSNNTSSNVRPSPKNFEDAEIEGAFDFRTGEFILAMCKDRAVDKSGPNFYPVPASGGLAAVAVAGVVVAGRSGEKTREDEGARG
jgi:hypothetical protein